MDGFSHSDDYAQRNANSHGKFDAVHLDSAAYAASAYLDPSFRDAMRVEKISLVDGKGGLNDHVLGSGIAKNEFSRLENYYTDEDGAYLRKRLGKELVQYAPIKPEAFTADANTLGLWTLDETSAPYLDTSGNGRNLSGVGTITAVSGIFSNGQRLTGPVLTAGAWTSNGSVLGSNPGVGILDGLSQFCMEAWCNIDPSFSGQPLTGTIAGQTLTFSDSGVVLIGTATSGTAIGPGVLVNGITVHRDWDSENNQHASDCYFKVTLNTNGIAGTQTVIVGRKVPFSRALHVRAEYDSVTGLLSLWVNGDLHAVQSVVGAGTVNDSTATWIMLGGQMKLAYAPTAAVYQTFKGWIDEARISNVTRTASEGFPFKEPRGMGFEFAKSDGTRQAVVSAEDGLYYTLGDTGWTEIATGFSETAFWDATFRKDILYLMNGADNPKAWNGVSLLDWGKPTVAPQLDLGAAGSVANGVHYFAYTYVYGDYETGLSPRASITVAANEQVNVSAIPSRHSNCTAVRLYVTKAGTVAEGSEEWYLWREITHDPNAPMQAVGAYTAGSPAGYDTDSGAFGVADGTLGGSDYPLIAAAVQTSITPNGQYTLGVHDRILVCGMSDEPYTIRWSELGAPDVWRVLSFVNAAADKGSLSAMASFYGEVHVSKSGESTLVMRGDNPANWTVLESLHPTVGCIDHWGYVHRFLADSDKYVLCFPGRDGFYEYAGQKIRKVSEKIQGTVDRLVQNNATRNEWITTTEAQFRAQLVAGSGGSASANVNAPSYETDGLRDVPGRLALLNQLAPFGLWGSENPLVSGNVIAVAKGASEGQFYFATDAANELYYTPDNFVSVQTIGGTPLAAGERIIQIVRRASDDFWFLITDSAGTDYTIGSKTVCKSSGGGKVYSVEDPLGATIGPVWAAGADTLYYDLDVPQRMSGNYDGMTRKLGNSFAGSNSGSALNIFMNHPQTMNVTQDTFISNPAWSVKVRVDKNADTLSGAVASTVYNVNYGTGTVVFGVGTVAGYYSMATQMVSGGGVSGFATVILRADYTRREYPRWRGGTFAPQAFWDAANNRLMLLGSTAEDANGNRTTNIYTLNSALARTTWSVSKNVSAIVPIGTALLMWTLVRDADSGNDSRGFDGRIEQSTLAAPATIIGSAALQANALALRLSYNGQNADRYLGLFKAFEGGQNTQDFYTYTGSIRSIPTATSVPLTLLALTADGDSGPMPLEAEVQTSTPYKWFVAVQNITNATLYTVTPSADSASTVAVFQADPYEGNGASGAQTGILSNLLFVAASGASGNYLWADRLYWYGRAADSNDARMIQFGVPGDWTVNGSFESEAHNFGTFSAFDSLVSSFNNGGTPNALTYSFRNAADPASLAAATYIEQQPNQKIAGFTPVAAYGQWRIAFTWTYDDDLDATTAPYANLVTIGFFLGNAIIPRIVGIHWEGRTYWACAEDGATYNNVVLVYQKNNTWTKIYAWNLKSMFRFRNQLHGLEAYQLVRLESGLTDMGSLIVGKARTGYIMGYVDKLITGIQANVAAFANNLFSNRPGYVKITPYQADSELTDAAWVFELPDSTSPEPRRVQGVPWSGDFTYEWVRSFAMEIATSEDTDGDYVPYVGQPEQVQQVDVTLEVTDETYDIPVR